MNVEQHKQLTSGVTNSQESPFSERSIMYHFLLMNRAGIDNYGVNIMIKSNWFERPPLATYRVKG